MSCITVVILIFYAIFKLDNLLGYKDYQIIESTSFEHYDLNQSFGYNNGFAIKAGLVMWDDGSATVEDPSYGELKFYMKSWSEEQTSTLTNAFVQLETHFCED